MTTITKERFITKFIIKIQLCGISHGIHFIFEVHT
jgi:hypothetical protein